MRKIVGLREDEGRTLMAIKALMAARGFKLSHQTIANICQRRGSPGAERATDMSEVRPDD